MSRQNVARWFAAAALGAAMPLAASTYFSISDETLRARSDLVVVVSAGASRVVPEPQHVAETWTRCSVELASGGTPGAEIEVAIPGGVLPDGRGSYLWMPDLVEGERYVLFLKHRSDGRYSLSEGALGVFTVDKTGTAAKRAAFTSGPMSEIRSVADLVGGPSAAKARPEKSLGVPEPQWVNFNPNPPSVLLARWTGGANVNVGFVDDDLADAPLGEKGVPGGGIPQLQSAINAFTGDPDSNINYHFIGEGSATVTIHLDNTDHFNGEGFPCETGIEGELGIAEIHFAGDHSFKGSTYNTLTNAFVWLRRWDCTESPFLTSAFENQMLHELGHTLGLGHPDRGVSPHDPGPDDWDPTPSNPGAVMLSLLDFNRPVGLGDDDLAGLCYLYGACNPNGPPAPTRAAAGIPTGTLRSTRGRK